MNRIQDTLQVIYNTIKKNSGFPTEEKIIYIVNNTSDYLLDGYVLETMGYEVEIQEWENDMYEDRLEQVRRADVLADYVYIEKDIFVECCAGDFPLRIPKDINAVLPNNKHRHNCDICGLLNYFHQENFILKDKHIIIFGDNVDLVYELIKSLATVTMIPEGGSNFKVKVRDADLIIILPEWKKTLNCYPVYIPIIDCGDHCVNAENRNVITDTNLLRIIGVVSQLW